MTTSDATLQIFCKAPAPGRVKTRLMPLLGDSGAAKLHADLTAQVIQSLSSKPGYELEIHTPDVNHPFFQQFRLPIRHQYGAGLGERMAGSLADGMVHAGRVVLIGTDCPLIDSNYVFCAFQALNDHRVVLGPAEDGGYGLIGVSGAVPEIFEDVSWGTDVVLSQTCRKLNQLRINYALLPLVWDVDRPEDLPRYQAWLADNPARNAKPDPVS